MSGIASGILDAAGLDASSFIYSLVAVLAGAWLKGCTWAATPIGIHALANLPATPIRMALAIVVFIAVTLILRGFALSREPGRPAARL